MGAAAVRSSRGRLRARAGASAADRPLGDQCQAIGALDGSWTPPPEGDGGLSTLHGNVRYVSKKHGYNNYDGVSMGINGDGKYDAMEGEKRC